MYVYIYIYIYIYIHTSTKQNEFTLETLGSMGPPPWEDSTVPLAPDGGHYVNACYTCPYINIYIYICIYVHPQNQISSLLKS